MLRAGESWDVGSAMSACRMTGSDRVIESTGRLNSGKRSRYRVATSILLTLAFTTAELAVLQTAAYGAPTPSTVELPTTIDDGPIPNAVANGVDCVSTTNCVAVGDFLDQIGITHAMTLQYTSGTWTAAQELAPVGPPDYTFSDLTAVSCESAGNCVAVGDYRIDTETTEGFYAVESGGTWARGEELPLPTDAGSAPAETAFVSVSCSATGTCQMLGEYLTNSPLGIIHSVVDTYQFGTGLSSHAVEISQLASQDGIALSSISCPDSTDCVAVGAQATEFTENATYVEESGGVWGTPAIITNSGGGSFPEEYLSSVSCVAVGDCVVGGSWLSTSGTLNAETYTEEAGAWGAPVNIGEPFAMNSPQIDSLSCVSSVLDCTASGALTTDEGALVAATAQMTDGVWGQFAPTSPPSGGISDHEFLGVSCVEAGQCTSVGYYNTPGQTGGTEAMAASWSPVGRPTSIAGLRYSRSGESVHLTWTAPSGFGSGFSHYETFATSKGLTYDLGPAASTSVTISKLPPGASYRLTVITVATDGQTSPPESVVVTIPAEVPTAPKITSVVGLPYGLEVKWWPPKSDGGATISSYKLTATCGGVEHLVRAGGSSRSASVHGIGGGEACIVRLYAVNHAGSSPSSPAVVGHARS